MSTIIRGKNRNKPWTVRYQHEDRQREKSFRTKAEASDFQAKFEHDSRERIFVDPRAANVRFEEVADEWLGRHPGAPKTRLIYESALRLHIKPVFGARALSSVARDREGVERFVRETLPGKDLGASTVRICYAIIAAVVNDAIKSGRLNQTRLRGIKIPAQPVRSDIAFASHEQIVKLADSMPEPYASTVYLMRGCGLRLGEALGVQPGDFMDEGRTLRLRRQLSPDGKTLAVMKHRDEDDYRDVPVPKYVLAAYSPVPPVSHRRYADWFTAGRMAAGLPDGFTPHVLRHVFASVCLAGGVPITDVSKWLGHRSIEITFGIYGHLVPASWSRALDVLDKEWNG